MEEIEMSQYQPVACGLYDQLEEIAVRKQTCFIDYVDEEGAAHRIQSRIIDLFSRDKEEFAELERKLLIRLDRIKRINDVAVATSCELQ